MINIWMMRAVAVMWMRYERQCSVVALERGSGMCGTPDVLGLTPDRYLVEVEIKRTMADFRANRKKWMARQRGISLGLMYTPTPAQFYFLVEAKMIDKCKAELPKFAGLMSMPHDDEPRREYCGIPYPAIRVKAPVIKAAKRLDARQSIRMAKHQAGTLSLVLNTLAEITSREFSSGQRRRSRVNLRT